MSTKQRFLFCKYLSMVVLLVGLVGCAIQPIRSVTPAAATPTALPATIATLVATTAPQVEGALASPDAQWRAEVVAYACTEIVDEGELRYEQLLLIEVSTGAQTEIIQQQINCGGLGAFGLAALCWSADSQTLYFTDAREGVPDGGSGDWQRPIFQVARSSGQIQPYTGEVQAGETDLPLPIACQ